MSKRGEFIKNIDWISVGLYFALLIIGWINIYSSIYGADQFSDSFFDITNRHIKQLLWIGSALILIGIIFSFNVVFFNHIGFIVYVVIVIFLVGVLLFGYEIAGSRSWFNLGFIKIQPSEFAKVAVALALSKYLGHYQIKLDRFLPIMVSLLMISFPALLIIAQGDTGSALVFSGFIVPLFREGFSKSIIIGSIFLLMLFLTTLFLGSQNINFIIASIIGLWLVLVYFYRKNKKLVRLFTITSLISILLVSSEGFILNEVLKPYQKRRIEVLFSPNIDPTGAGWQVTQSKIAIGSGGIWGKGFLKGTQTKYDFIPDQSTDFIFCTIGEEYGWFGSILFLIVAFGLIYRLVILSEKQKSSSNRIYGYAVVGILLFHYVINIMMTVGLFPVIGIPLPYVSYGGSSLWASTILLFIFIRMNK